MTDRSVSVPFTPPDLSGKVALVTGASRGIGRACALALAEAGADLVLAAKTLRPREGVPGSLVEVAAEVEALGRRALPLRVNVRKADEVAAMVERAEEEFGRVDVLVNNAGALWWRPITETPPKKFDLVMEVNVRAAYCATHDVLPGMLERGEGCVVQMSPPLDERMLAGKVAYAVSKFGMSLLARGLAQEVGDVPIRSFALWPATAIDTQATRHFGLGGPEGWRRPEIVAHALLAAIALPLADVQGGWLVDEDVLARIGVTDLDRYLCVPGGRPIRIVGEGSAAAVWKS